MTQARLYLVIYIPFQPEGARSETPIGAKQYDIVIG
jgi:hypothetical protein